MGAIKPDTDDREPHQAACDFRDHRRPCDTLKAIFQPQAKPDRQDNVGAIDYGLQQQSCRAHAAAEHIAEDCIIGECGRRRERPDHKIG